MMFVGLLSFLIYAIYCANTENAGYMVLGTDRPNNRILYSCLKTEDQPLNFSSHSIVLPPEIVLYGFVYDQVNDQVYMSDYTGKKIFRTDMNGTNIEEIYSGEYAFCMAIDDIDRQLYYYLPNYRQMRVYNISSGDHRTLFSLTSYYIYDLQLDRKLGYVFFTYYDEGIYRFHIESSSTYETFISSEGSVGLGLDPTGVRLYWTNYNTDEIRSCDTTDGGNVELILSSDSIPELVNPTDVIAIGQYIYVRALHDHLIRAHLNGSCPRTDEGGTIKSQDAVDKLSVVKLNPEISSRVVCQDEMTTEDTTLNPEISSRVCQDEMTTEDTTPCRYDSYGDKCELTCNCECASCHHETGCDGGCHGNWLRDSCTTGIIASNNTKVNPGQTSTFQCDVEGDVTGVNIQLLIDNEPAEETGNTESNGVTRVTFSGEASLSLAYLCLLTKDSEIANQSHSVILFNLPTYTGRPSSSSVTGSSVELSWREWNTSDGDLGDPPVVGYVIHYKKTSASDDWSTTSQVNNPTATVTSLSWEEQYSFAVAAVREGAGGEGQRGSELVTETTICGEPSAPEATRNSSSESPKTINISWKPLTNTQSKCSTGIERYTISYKPGNTDVSLTKETTSTSYTIMGLDTYTEYTISVTARNKDFTGTVRELKEFSPEEIPPVPVVSAKREGSFLTVSVTPYDSCIHLYGNIKGYDVRYRTGNDEWKNESITEKQGKDGYRIKSVEDVNYDVGARVINGAGVGDWSIAAQAEQITSTGSSIPGFMIAVLIVLSTIIFVGSLAFILYYRYNHSHGNKSTKCQVRDDSLKTKTRVTEESNELYDYANTVTSSALRDITDDPIQQDQYDVIETETQITDEPNYEIHVTYDDVIPSTSKREMTTGDPIEQDPYIIEIEDEARVTEHTDESYEIPIKYVGHDSASKAIPIYTN